MKEQDLIVVRIDKTAVIYVKNCRRKLDGIEDMQMSNESCAGSREDAGETGRGMQLVIPEGSMKTPVDYSKSCNNAAV